MKISKLVIYLILGFVISGCGLFGDDEDSNEFAGLSTEEQFYERALDQLNGQNYRGAISTYQALESRFPFGRFAEQAQIEIVYAHYRIDDMEASRAAADRFIRLHPDSDNIDYATICADCLHLLMAVDYLIDSCLLITLSVTLVELRNLLMTSHNFWHFTQIAYMPGMPEQE